jgi:hypothetical protein
MLLQAQGRQLQIHQPHMLYFLTYPGYPIDKYNVIWVVGRYLREYLPLILTNDNKRRKRTYQLLHMKKHITSLAGPR